jgi:hypothetical protein
MAATAATAGDDERRVTGTNDESATPATASLARHTRAADSDLQHLACGQTEGATDLGTETARADKASKRTGAALRAKREDLVGVGRRHREGNETTGISEVERCSAGRRP